MAESGAPTEPAAASVYQLRVVVAEVSPLIWRRLLVSATTTIAELHAVLQAAFGWSGQHPAPLRHPRPGVRHRLRRRPGFPRRRPPGRADRSGAAGHRALRLSLRLHRRLAPGPAGRKHRGGRGGAELPALHRRAPRRSAGGLRRAVGVPRADPAPPGVRGDAARAAGLLPLLGLERFDRRALNRLARWRRPETNWRREGTR